MTAECDNPVARGFPFRLGLYCDRVAYARRRRGSRLYGRAASARPGRSTIRCASSPNSTARPRVDTPRNGSLKLDWERLRASVRWAEPLPERVSVEGGNVAASLATGAPLATRRRLRGAYAAERRRISTSPSSFEGLALDPALVDGRTLPAFSGESDLTIKDGVEPARHRGPKTCAASRARSARRRCPPGPKTGLTVSGPFSIGEDGLIDATLKITVRDPNGLSAMLAEAFPEKRKEIASAFPALAFMGNEPTLPLRIDKGRGDARLHPARRHSADPIADGGRTATSWRDARSPGGRNRARRFPGRPR